MTHEKGSKGMEHGTPRQLPKSDWETVIEVLNEKGIPLQVFVYPERYMDQYNVARRRGAIKEMFRRGETLDELESKTPFTKRYLRDILANGSEPHLPGLGEPEADVNANNPSRTDGA